MSFDFNQAMCVYLGGEPDSAAIQIGDGDNRLVSRYGEAAPEIKATLDAVLEAAVEQTENTSANVKHWLAQQLPNVSDTCRNKIAAHVFFQITH